MGNARKWGMWALFVILAGVVVAGAFFVLHEPLERRAERVLRQASALQEEVRRAGIREGLDAEFDQASRLLEEARNDWDRGEWAACLARGQDALRRFQLLLGLANHDFPGSGQIISVSGRVEIQRAHEARWERGRERQTLHNGDFVRTASDGTAEILFSDGTVFKVGTDSLLEVHRGARVGRTPTPGEVKMRVGQINVYTALSPSSVVTDVARADVDQESRVGVEVAEDSSTVVAAYEGRARVTGSGGSTMDLGRRQAVTADAGGALGSRRTVPDPPPLVHPLANHLINLDRESRIELSWRTVPGAAYFDLQVSRSRLFSPGDLEFETNRRAENSATLNVLLPGTYYWRVAALSPTGERSEWGSPRSFRALRDTRVVELQDTEPPPLQDIRWSQMGNVFIFQGRTRPGTTVTINGEPAEVGGDGTFRKAVSLYREGLSTVIIRATDPSGNTSEHRETVLVEVE